MSAGLPVTEEQLAFLAAATPEELLNIHLEMGTRAAIELKKAFECFTSEALNSLSPETKMRMAFDYRLPLFDAVTDELISRMNPNDGRIRTTI